jgi:hypothetical protein
VTANVASWHLIDLASKAAIGIEPDIRNFTQWQVCPLSRHSSDENAAPRTNGSNAKAALQH